MAKDFSKGIRKDSEYLDQIDKKVKYRRVAIQCRCTHKNDSRPQLIRTGDTKSGGSLVRCKNCGKVIDLSVHTQEEIDTAWRIIDSLCDVAKLKNSNPQSEALAKIIKFQEDSYHMKNLLNNVMAADAKRNAERDAHRREQREQGEVTFNVGGGDHRRRY